jgi:hypothetical protein
MTVTLRQIIEAQNAMQSLVVQQLPVKQAYHLARLIRMCEPEVKQFNEQRNALIKEHGKERLATEGERPMHGDTVHEVSPDQLPIFRAKLQELLETEISLDRPKIVLNGTLQITAAELMALDPFVTVEE